MRKFLSVLLAVMMVLSTASFAAPSAVTVVDSNDFAAALDLTAVEEKLEAELAAALKDSAPHGELVFELNFDNLANGTAISNQQKLNTLGATLSSKIEKADDLFFVLSQYGDAVVENGALKAKKTGTGKWPQIQVSIGNRNSMVQDGVIYMEADMMVVRDKTQTATVNLGLTGYREFLDGESDAGSGLQSSVQTIYTANDNEWYHLSGSYALNDEDGATGLECVIFLPTYSAESDLEDYFYLDNLRLYYKPLEAEVTVKANGKEGKTTVSTTEAVSLEDLLGAVDLGLLYTPVGAYIGDEFYTAEDTFYITSDTEVELELEMVDTRYYSSEYGAQVFNIDFEGYEVGTQVVDNDSLRLLESFKTPFSDKLYNHEFTNWAVMSNSGKTYIMDDPTNPGNTVIGVEDITSGGYPNIRIDVWADYHLNYVYGFVDGEEGVLTLTYDVWDKNGTLTFTERFGGNSSKVINTDDPDKPYFVENEDTASELETNVAGEWRTNVTTYAPSNWSNMGSSKEVSYTKIHAVTPNADTYYIDNIKLFWKPLKADVTLDTNGYAINIEKSVISDFDTTGKKVSDLLDMAGVEYDEASYTFKGLSLDPEGNGTVYGLNDTLGIPCDCALYFIMEEGNDLVTEHGFLVMEMDFEDVTNVEDQAYIKDIGRVNPNFANSDKWQINLSNLSSPAEIVTDSERGGKVLKTTYTTTGKTAWPQFLFGYLENKSDLSTLIKTDGTFHITSKVKVDYVPEANLYAANLTANGMKDGVHQSSSGIFAFDYFVAGTQILDNEWKEIGGTRSIADAGIDGPNKFTFVFQHNEGNTVGTVTTIYLDDIKVYWKPDTVNLTVYGGSNASYAAKTTLKNVPTTATIEDVIAMLPASEYGQITGLADMNGDKLDSLNLISNASVVAVWTPWNVIEGAGQEFEISGANYSNTQGMFSSNGFGPISHLGGGGSGQVTKAYITMYRGKSDVNDGYGLYTTGNNLVYKQLTPNAGDSNEHGGLTITDDYTVAAVPQGSSHRVTINVNLPANNTAKYAVIKYKFQNVPDLNSDFAKNLGATAAADGKSATFTTREGNTDTYSHLVDYTAKYYAKQQNDSYHYSGGLEFEAGTAATKEGDGVKVDIKELEDQWIYDFLPINETLNTEGVKGILIDRPNHFRDMVTVWDFVMFVSEGTEEDEVVLPNLGGTQVNIKAPTTSPDAEARVANDQYGAGVRFKATVKKATAKGAEDLGWIITTENYAIVNDITEDSLSLEDVAESAGKVKVAYQRQNGVDKVNFFDSNDTEATFAAVFYGIPTKNIYDYIYVRPFAKAGDKVVYGETVSAALYDVAIYPYIELDTMFYDFFDPAIIEEGFSAVEELIDYGLAWTTEAYDDLSEEQQAFIMNAVNEMLAYAAENM